MENIINIDEKCIDKNWSIEYQQLKENSESLWTATGLNDDIAKGWKEAKENNKLYAFGPYPIPLEIVQNIENETSYMLLLAGCKKHNKIDQSYVNDTNSIIESLQKQLENKDKQIDSLIEAIASLQKINSD